MRQAIAYALPYDAVLKNIIFGRGSQDHSIVMPTAPEYTPAWSMYTTNLDKARQLMAQAGNPQIDIPLHYLQGDTDQTNTAILIQGNLKQIGITTTLTPETQAGLFDVVDARSSPAAGAPVGPPGLELFNWSGFSDDPSVVIGYWATTGGINNYPLWSSPEVDQINAQYAKQDTSAARAAAYQKAQQTIAAAAPLDSDRVDRNGDGGGQRHRRSVVLGGRLRPVLDAASDRAGQQDRPDAVLVGTDDP